MKYTKSDGQTLPASAAIPPHQPHVTAGWLTPHDFFGYALADIEAAGLQVRSWVVVNGVARRTATERGPTVT